MGRNTHRSSASHRVRTKDEMPKADPEATQKAAQEATQEATQKAAQEATQEAMQEAMQKATQEEYPKHIPTVICTQCGAHFLEHCGKTLCLFCRPGGILKKILNPNPHLADWWIPNIPHRVCYSPTVIEGRPCRNCNDNFHAIDVSTGLCYNCTYPCSMCYKADLFYTHCSHLCHNCKLPDTCQGCGKRCEGRLPIYFRREYQDSQWWYTTTNDKFTTNPISQSMEENYDRYCLSDGECWDCRNKQ